MSPSANADAQRMVSLYADGQKRVFATDDNTVGDVLVHSGVILGVGDRVEPMATTVIPQGFFNINVYRARPVTVVDGYASYHIFSAFQSPRLLAQAAGLTVYPEDTYETSVITDVVNEGAIGVKVIIHRATPITVHVDGKILAVRTQGKTVAQALAGAGINLGPKDAVTPPLTAPIEAGMVIAVARVAEVEQNITIAVPRVVQHVNDPNLPKGQTKVKTEGADGQRVVLYRIHYRDGVEINRQLLKLVSEVKPVTRVEIVGTKVFFSGSVEFWRPQVLAAATQYGVDPNLMLGIMRCESTGNANASNGTHFGLYQYSMNTWLISGGSSGNIFDGGTQIKLTAHKIASFGLSPWAASQSCWSKYQ